MTKANNHVVEKNKTRTDPAFGGIVSKLNDRFRSSFDGGQVMLTSGVLELGAGAIDSILSTVRTFSDFNADNDPHGEHDFGSFTHANQQLFWKIDYYDQALEFGSPDPSNPTVTRRVLTIMLASEY